MKISTPSTKMSNKIVSVSEPSGWMARYLSHLINYAGISKPSKKVSNIQGVSKPSKLEGIDLISKGYL